MVEESTSQITRTTHQITKESLSKMKLKTLEEIDLWDNKDGYIDDNEDVIKEVLKQEAITWATIFWINHKRMLEFSKNPPDYPPDSKGHHCSATALSSEEYKTQALLYNEKYSLICTLFNLWEGQLNYSLPTEKERKDFLKYLKDLKTKVKEFKRI